MDQHTHVHILSEGSKATYDAGPMIHSGTQMWISFVVHKLHKPCLPCLEVWGIYVRELNVCQVTDSHCVSLQRDSVAMLVVATADNHNTKSFFNFVCHSLRVTNVAKSFSMQLSVIVHCGGSIEVNMRCAWRRVEIKNLFLWPLVRSFSWCLQRAGSLLLSLIFFWNQM